MKGKSCMTEGIQTPVGKKMQNVNDFLNAMSQIKTSISRVDSAIKILKETQNTVVLKIEGYNGEQHPISVPFNNELGLAMFEAHRNNLAETMDWLTEILDKINALIDSDIIKSRLTNLPGYKDDFEIPF